MLIESSLAQAITEPRDYAWFSAHKKTPDKIGVFNKRLKKIILTRREDLSNLGHCHRNTPGVDSKHHAFAPLGP